MRVKHRCCPSGILILHPARPFPIQIESGAACDAQTSIHSCLSSRRRSLFVDTSSFQCKARRHGSPASFYLNGDRPKFVRDEISWQRNQFKCLLCLAHIAACHAAIPAFQVDELREGVLPILNRLLGTRKSKRKLPRSRLRLIPRGPRG